MDTETEVAYTVALRDFSELPVNERIAAEVRYCRMLERRLGSHDAVADIFRQVLVADAEGDSSEAMLTLAMQWRLVTTAARQAAFQGLGESPEAYFDVRLA